MMPRIDTAPAALSPAGGGTVAPGSDARQAALQSALTGLVGQSLPAEVLSNFTDGSSLVKIAGLNVRLLLPPGIAVGSEVPLTVIAASPRPTFQFGSGSAGDLATLLYSETGAVPGGSAAAASYGALASQDAPLPGAARPLPGAPPTAADPNPAAPPGTAAATIASAAAQLIATAGAQAADPAAVAAAVDAAAADATAAEAAMADPADAAAAYPANNPAANPATSPAANPATGPAANPAASPAANPAATPGGAAATAPTAVNAALAAIAAGIEAGAEADGAAPAAALAPGAPAAAAGAAAAEAQKPPSLAAALLGRAPLTPSDQLPDLNAGTPGAALSSAARALTIMLSAAQSLPGTPMVLTGKTPLVPDGPPVPEQLAKTLQDTISKSGLFYESHVSDWVKGDLSLPDLAREPQMQRMMEEAAAPRPANAGPDLSAAQMVNLQLHTQEQARVQWNGQAWPGQNMQWDIRREQREGGRGGDGEAGEPEQVWRSGVRFRFPMLGEVSAAVTIVGDQVHIQVVTDSDGAATTLRAHAGELETAMAAASAPLSSLAIAADL